MDIDDFIDLKKNSGEERRRAHDLFPALWISDLFMERVIADENWTLFDPADVKELSETYGSKFKTLYVNFEQDESIRKKVIKAKDLWKKILTSYYESGSPFLCFKDTANVANPNKHVGHIRSSNLCTEIFQNTSPNHYQIKVWINNGLDFVTFEEEDDVLMETGTVKKAKKVTSLDTIVMEGLGKYKVFNVEKHKIDGKTAVCNLASINLARVKTREDIERVTPIAVRMLDNVIELNFYPLNKVKFTNLDSRSIGLGVMGEAEMLAVDQITWGSRDHFNRINAVMESISYNAISASSDLATEKGTYPTFEGSEWSHGVMPHDYARTEVLELTDDNETGYYDWSSLREKVKTKGMRNGYLMAIAPTSSISILVGTTQAIEPVYKKRWYEENLSGLIPVVVPKLSAETWNFYTPAYDVDQKDLIRAAAVRQKWIDQGQSTNVFMALDKASGRQLHEIYTLAWSLGLKSTYYLRSQSPEAEKKEEDVVDRSIECSGCQ